MDTQPISISPETLHRSLGTANAPLAIDVRRAAAFDADDRLIAGAIRRDPATLGSWQGALPAARPIVAYCVHGHEVSQQVVAALRAAGRDARYLAGGIADWVAQERPTRRKLGPSGKWVTTHRLP